MEPLVREPAAFGLFLAQAVQLGEWIIPALVLFVVASVQFNSPPTNRSGTTFALFSFGVIFYYALIITLWLIVTIAVGQRSVGLGHFGSLLQLKPDAQGEVDQYKPMFAALIIVAASQFPAARA